MAERICVKCGSTKDIEDHHISYSPPIKELICHKCHQKEHNIQVIEGELTLVMRQYHKYTKLLVSLKNWKTAWKKDFEDLEDKKLDEWIEDLQYKRKSLLKEAEAIMGEEGELHKRWRGIGVRHIAYLLAFAHPKRFPSLRKFLYYCGYKGEAKKNKNYSRIACGTGYLIAESFVRHKNEIYYPLYLEIKKSFETEKPIIAHRKALNRIITLWLKEFYKEVLVESKNAQNF